MLWLAWSSSAALAQAQPAPAPTPDAGHLGHHPQKGSGAASGEKVTGGMAMPAKAPGKSRAAPMADSDPAASGGMGGAKSGGMMDGMMGGAPQKEFFPSLMDLPSLTPQKRAEIEGKAHARMQTGLTQMAAALANLSEATSKNDAEAMQAATLEVKQAQAVYESGLTAHRALLEGQPPQSVALGWFNREMSLLPPLGAEPIRDAFGLPPSWFHFLIIAVLASFALAMIGMYFFKMRRAAALFGRIEASKMAPSPGDAPELAGGKLPSGDSPPEDDQPPSDQPPGGKLTGHKPASSGENPDATSPTGLKTEPPPPLTANWRGQLRVGSIITETPSVKTFRLLPSSGERLPFTFVPGQFLNLAFSIGGARMNRSYSISSSPNQRQHVDLTVRREPRGAVSRHINDLLQVGDLIEAGGPVGKFTFDGTGADSIVLISGGVGITPMVSISRYLTEQKWPGDIFFLFTCRVPIDYILGEEIAALQKRNPKLHVAVTVSRPQGTDWEGARGRITKEWLMQTVPDLVSRRVHICGPVPMMDTTKALLAEIGVPPEQVKTEAFGTPAPTPGSKPTGPATGPLVTFSKNSKSSKIHEGETILELSEALGLAIEFSCRVGTCGVCKVKMTAGQVEQEVQDALNENDKSGGIILACQAKPIGEVTVEA